jgi:hypothetical protein
MAEWQRADAGAGGGGGNYDPNGLISTLLEMNARTPENPTSVRHVRVDPIRSNFESGAANIPDTVRPPFMPQLAPSETNRLLDYENERLRRRQALLSNQIVRFATMVATRSGIAVPRSLQSAALPSTSSGTRPLSSLLPSGIDVPPTPAPTDNPIFPIVYSGNGTVRPLTAFEMSRSEDAATRQEGQRLIEAERLRDATQYLYKSEVTGLVEIDPVIDSNARVAHRELIARFKKTLRDVTLEELIYSEDYWVIFADLVAASITEVNSGPAARRDHLQLDYHRAYTKRASIMRSFETARHSDHGEISQRVYDESLRRAKRQRTSSYVVTAGVIPERLIAAASPLPREAPQSGFLRTRLGQYGAN